MSAITETEAGCEMVCIIAFAARPRGPDNRTLPGPRREFRVGEHVRFLASFFERKPTDNPTGYMAVFEPLGEANQGRNAAVETYFVSLDCWDGLKRHFRRMSSTKNGPGARRKAARPPGSKARRVAS